MLKKLREKSKTYEYAFNSFCTRNPDLPLSDNINNLPKYTDQIIDRLNNIKSPETRRRLYHVFHLLYKWSHNPKEAEMFKQESAKIRQELNEFLQNNLPRSTKEAECLGISFAHIRNNYPVRQNKNKKNMNPKMLLFNLLVHQDQTPRLEYRMLQWKPKKKKNANYITVDKKTKKVKMVINDYKTAKTYGVWEFELQPDVSEYVTSFIEYHKPKANSYFFKTNTGKPYLSNKFSKYVKQMFKWVIGQRVNMNCLRKIKEKALFHQNPQFMNVSIKDKDQWLIDNFRHNLKTAMLYYNPLVNQPPMQRVMTSTGSMPQVPSRVPESARAPAMYTTRRSFENNIKSFLTEMHSTMNKYNISYRLLRQLICKDVLI